MCRGGVVAIVPAIEIHLNEPSFAQRNSPSQPSMNGDNRVCDTLCWEVWGQLSVEFEEVARLKGIIVAPSVRESKTSHAIVDRGVLGAATTHAV